MKKREFDCLNVIQAASMGKITQRMIAKSTSYSLGSVNDALNNLKNQGLIGESYTITQRGLQELEPYKVKNAVIMAAGLSSRFVPLSFDKPKGLSIVRGQVLIEREIEQLIEAGITEIFVVIGYMKELYYYLQDKYNVHLVLNTEYALRNNNGSIFLVKEFLDNSYICSSDDYFITNPFEKYVYESYYAVEYMEGATSERGVKVDENDRIVSTYPSAKDDWVLMGHVYWNQSFSRAFIEKLVSVYDDEATKPLLWERIFDRFILELPPLYIRKYNKEIYEFDSIEDLIKFDPMFITNTDSYVIENICQTLNCQSSDLADFTVMKAGQTNETCTFMCGNSKYTYRNCTPFTRNIVNRERECDIQQIAQKEGLDTTVEKIDPVMGWKISRYVDSPSFQFEEIVDDVILIMRKLHNIDTTDIPWEFDFEKEINRIKILTHSHTRAYDGYEEGLFDNIKELCGYVAADGWKKVLCHNDINAGNFLREGNKLQCIDWEYAGINDPGYDIAKLVLKTESVGKDAEKKISDYYGRDCTLKEYRHVMACGAIEDYYWFIWGIYLELNGRNLGDSIEIWHRHATDYGRTALEMYREGEKK